MLETMLLTVITFFVGIAGYYLADRALHVDVELDPFKEYGVVQVSANKSTHA